MPPIPVRNQAAEAPPEIRKANGIERYAFSFRTEVKVRSV